MKPFVPEPARRWIGLGLFLIGMVATVIALQIPALSQAIKDLEHAGYFGAIVVGIMYAISLTSATATLVFAQIPDSLNPIMIAVAGGFGAMLYDISIFSLTRRTSFRERVAHWSEALTHHEKLPRWLSITIGAIIIASPLPDELGATFFGTSNLPFRPFLALSFSLNVAGILFVTGVF